MLLKLHVSYRKVVKYFHVCVFETSVVCLEPDVVVHSVLEFVGYNFLLLFNRAGRSGKAFLVGAAGAASRLAAPLRTGRTLFAGEVDLHIFGRHFK